MKRLTAAGALALCALSAQAQELRPDQREFRALFRELVEINTTLSAGSCTAAAEAMARHLRAAGLPEQDIHLITQPEHPKEGSLVAILRGSDATARPMLLLAHLDVVEAKREDWTRDPFTLVEEGGYFYARGVSDDKAMASIWVDTLQRLHVQGFKAARDIKLALTCGEETAGAFNGAEFLAANERELIDAAFALNEGAWGMLDEHGKRVTMSVQAGEKFAQNYRLEVVNPGGHSSRPVKDNAIYHLAAGLGRVGAYEFPVQLNDTTRAYFRRTATLVDAELGAAMLAMVADPDDTVAVAAVVKDPSYNAMLRTTCVATMLEGGHATNALPQRARANVNCRIYPGTSAEDVRLTLERIVADPAIAVSMPEAPGPTALIPPLTPAILAPIEQVAAQMYPGVPVLPILQAGATDGKYLGVAGIPTYGIGALFFDPDLGGIHGLNERLRTQSLYDGRDYLFELVKLYAADSSELP
jgi:acetylornithine deacetylase/succinyl-diaminopimelate desuccinylase-like protein